MIIVVAQIFSSYIISDVVIIIGLFHGIIVHLWNTESDHIKQLRCFLQGPLCVL